MFRRPSTVVCYYCQSRVTPTSSNFNPRSFRCPECACWNRYDAKGEIMSDEPAMHDTSLNTHSFAKRASPRTDRIRTEYRTNPFCHDCQTNQMLIVNLLGNFLPDSSDPDYERRLAALPEYERSLQARYPPVCANCASEVEERIAEKDRMARTSALGRMLRDTRAKQHNRRISAAAGKREKLPLKLFAWRARGLLWATTVACSFGLAVYFASGRTLSTSWDRNLAMSPVVILLSIIWTFWDPSYSSMQKAYLQGRDLRIHGRSQYIRLQGVAWIMRLISTTLLSLPLYKSTIDPLRFTHEESSLRMRIYFGVLSLLELIILVSSFSSLRIQKPPQIRLLDTSRSRLSTPELHSSRSSTPNPSHNHNRASSLSRAPTFDPDSLLAPLSLSNQPIFTSSQAHNPIFGLPSLGNSLSSGLAPTLPGDAMHVDTDMNTTANDNDDDAMDWAPLDPPSAPSPAATSFLDRVRQAAVRKSDEDVWLRPQRFFPPEQPTGLEGLLARTGLADVVGSSLTSNVPSTNNAGAASPLSTTRWHWSWVYAASLVPVLGFAWRAWSSRGGNVFPL